MNRFVALSDFFLICARWWRLLPKNRKGTERFQINIHLQTGLASSYRNRNHLHRITVSAEISKNHQQQLMRSLTFGFKQVLFSWCYSVNVHSWKKQKNKAIHMQTCNSRWITFCKRLKHKSNYPRTSTHAHISTWCHLILPSNYNIYPVVSWLSSKPRNNRSEKRIKEVKLHQIKIVKMPLSLSS